MKEFKLFIGGKDIDTGIYEYFPYADKVITDFRTTYRMVTALKRKNEYPPDVEDFIFARYSVGGDNTNKDAIDSAFAASQKFRYFPISVRRKMLGDIHKNLVNKKEELLNLLIIEGHPLKLAEWEFSGMEKGLRKRSLDYFKDEMWEELGSGEGETVYLVRKADGVVCVSPPKNAPCSNSLALVLALLGGNTIIVKPPLRTPLSTIYLWKEIVWKAVEDNGGPRGTINIVLGNSKRIMDEWLKSPLVNDIAFFGQSDMGLEIGNRIYQAGKKPILELSGNDFMAVWKDADLKDAVKALSDAFLGSTQICMVPKTALVHEEIFDKFSSMLLDEIRKLKIGLPSDPETCLTPVLKIKEFYEFLEDAKAKGGKVIFGGDRMDHNGKKDIKGPYLSPTVVTIDDDRNIWDVKCFREENFFPLLPLIRVSGVDDKYIFSKMIKMINLNEYGLRTSVWVKSGYFTRRFIRYIDNCGLLRINSRHVDFSLYLSTHGGTGKTGGPFGEMNYMWQKTTHLQGVSLTRKNKTASLK